MRWPGIFRLMSEITVLSYWASNIKNQFLRFPTFELLMNFQPFFYLLKKYQSPKGKETLNMFYDVFVKITATLHEYFP